CNRRAVILLSSVTPQCAEDTRMVSRPPSRIATLSESADFLSPSGATASAGINLADNSFKGRTACVFGALRRGFAAVVCFVALDSLAVSHPQSAAAATSSDV